MKNEWKAKTSESVPHFRLKIAEGLHYRLTIQCKSTKSILSTHKDPSPKRWITSQYYEAHLKAKCEKYEKMSVSKHCQRRSRPEGWVLLTKVTSSYTNHDQIPKFKISTKHQHFDQILTSKSWLNIRFITSPSLSSKILTNFQFQNFAWTSASNSWLNLVYEVWKNLATLGQSRQGLDWIIGPGYSFVVFSTNRGI